MAAVVAGHGALVAVQDQRDVAVRALPHAPAGAAGEEVRPAAAVEQHDGLARVDQRLVRARVHGAGGGLEVDDLHRRHRRAVDAPRQPDAPQRVDRLGPRRRAAADQHRAVLAGAALGDQPRVVARVALVLVGAVVLLVDDDEPEVGDRREDRAARPDADARLARAQAAPLVVALPRAELGVQDRDGVAEARHEAVDHLRRQPDLGDEDQHAAALGQRLGGGAQVDLGLARAGDAVQEQLGRIGSGADLDQDRVQRRLLVGRERRRGLARADRVVLGRAPAPARADRAPARGPPGGAATRGRCPRSAAAAAGARAAWRSGASPSRPAIGQSPAGPPRPRRCAPPTAGPSRARRAAAASATAPARASRRTRAPARARGRPGRPAARRAARAAARPPCARTPRPGR